jgi:hypothetical protein
MYRILHFVDTPKEKTGRSIKFVFRARLILGAFAMRLRSRIVGLPHDKKAIACAYHAQRSFTSH